MKTFMAFITRILNLESKLVKGNASPVRKPKYSMVPNASGAYYLYKHTGTNLKLITIVGNEQEARRCIYNLERPEIILNVSE